jgi:hypothetical protein
MRRSSEKPSTLGSSSLRPPGVEPGTYGLEVRCSVQLSYGRITSLPSHCNKACGGRQARRLCRESRKFFMSGFE